MRGKTIKPLLFCFLIQMVSILVFILLLFFKLYICIFMLDYLMHLIKNEKSTTNKQKQKRGNWTGRYLWISLAFIHSYEKHFGSTGLGLGGSKKHKKQAGPYQSLCSPRAHWGLTPLWLQCVSFSSQLQCANPSLYFG